ncbi:MAG: aspartate kinase [Phycisphaerales bacterium]
MSLIVMKFGGTSVGDLELIRRAAGRVAQRAAEGHQVVVVVSAMGHSTDELVRMALSLTPDPPDRELDMLLSTGEQVSIALLAIALAQFGRPAVSFTGGQVGLKTSPTHTRARVKSIDAERIIRELDAGRIVVVAGFQGVDDAGSITTLGRGGSDTTAVALAAALHSEVCEIFTDVDGVYTADPRRAPSARKLSRISYDEMLELAVLGAGVMHARAVQFGKKYGVPIHVRHSHRPDPGTMIVKESPEMEESTVIGCALKEDLGRVTLLEFPNSPGVTGALFKQIADADILVDDIIQTESEKGASISFTVEHTDLADVKPIAERVLQKLGAGKLVIDVGLSKISVVGLGMRSHSGVAATMFAALGDIGVNISNITTSEIKISCIIDRPNGGKALEAVHAAFGLGRSADEAGGPTSGAVVEPGVAPSSAASS